MNVDHYKRDGYYIARSLLSPELVERVYLDMHCLFLQQLKLNGYVTAQTLHHDMRRLFNANLKVYLATLTLCAKLTSLWALYMQQAIRYVIGDLGLSVPVFQTAPVMHVMAPDLQVPGGYHGFGAHQDWPTLQGSLDTVTIWLPFTAVDEDSFTLEVIPGSHLNGLRPSARKDHIFEVDEEHYAASAFVPVEAEPGDVVFMSAFSVHRSGQRGTRLRVSASMRYENAGDPTFIARGYPFAQKRSVVPELITPGFPSEAQVRKVFS